jgi:hypothetical protein
MSEKPKGISCYDWAKYNAGQDHTLAVLVGEAEPDFDLTPYEVCANMASPLAEPARTLMQAVRGAASELEGSSEKGDRIAVQLITALSRFAQETGL